MSMKASLPVSRQTADDNAAALSPFEQIRYAREILRLEAAALEHVAAKLGTTFSQAVECLFKCRANVIVTGMGKAGLIGQKIAATLASTGTRSHFLHPAEAFHGDLGRIHRDDVLLVLSQSGETEEVTRLLPSLADLGVETVAITSHDSSALGHAASVVLELGPLQEACSLGLAPSTSTTAMLAVGDALALVTSRMRRFSAEDFARFHPGGSLGRHLSKVDEQMRGLDQCRVANQQAAVRKVLTAGTLPGRRSGAIMLVDDANRLVGIFTDSDLARLFERRRDGALDEPIRNVMTSQPITVPSGSMVRDALDIMGERKISELPVVCRLGCPLGLLDITDLLNRNFVDDFAHRVAKGENLPAPGGPPEPDYPVPPANAATLKLLDPNKTPHRPSA